MAPELLVQGSPEWLAARAGHATASRFADVLAKIKSGESASRRNYRTQLVTERLTGLPVEGYRNAAMEWGNAQEPAAREEIEERLGFLVEPVGFVPHPEMKWVGASPDGYIRGLWTTQIKCPYVSTNHVETIEAGMPPSHVAQVQGELWVTGRERCLFASFDPRMPPNLRLYHEWVDRDNDYIARLAREVEQFLIEVDEMTKRLEAR